jgi:WhiB family redox-sensing transcriptional regulator
VTLTWIREHDWDAEDWRDQSLCRDSNPELFFPIGATGMAIDQIDAAKQICAQCPVSTPCLEFALATNQEAGIWGGATEEERRKLRKEWVSKTRAAS